MKQDISHVTADDIASGVPSHPEQCPVALAIRRLVPPNITVTVGAKVFFIDDGKILGKGQLPPEATDFILRFDARRQVAPFEFPITLPEMEITNAPETPQN